jgi:iron complex transport system ATP-binding protein
VTTVLSAQDLQVGFRLDRRRDRVVADRLTVAVDAGQFVCLVGPNGAGKSTLLRTLAGLQPALAGTVTLNGTDLRRLRRVEIARHLAAVLTDQHDTGRIVARELVGLGRHPYTGWLGQLDTNDRDIVDAALHTVSAGHLADRVVSELSDGERQRVMIARALAQEPAVVLLDEPAAFLDVTARVELVALLRGLAREQGLAVVLATHDLELALRSADRMWLLSANGALSAGLPEQVVAEGLLDRTFPNANWAFDPIQWRYVYCGTPTGVATVAGSSLHASLTRRVLDREGVVVDPPHPAARVQLAIEVRDSPSAQPTLIARHAGGTETHRAFQSLADLARRVASHAPSDERSTNE